MSMKAIRIKTENGYEWLAFFISEPNIQGTGRTEEEAVKAAYQNLTLNLV